MRFATALLVFLLACSDSEPGDRGEDAGRDAAVARDARVEPPDGGQDAGVDSGPACECSSGACCDGCHYRPDTYVCQDDELVDTGCSGSGVCSGKGLILNRLFESRRCTGFDAACSGSTFGDHTVTTNCDTSQGFPTNARCEDPATGDAYCTWGPTCSTEHP